MYDVTEHLVHCGPYDLPCDMLYDRTEHWVHCGPCDLPCGIFFMKKVIMNSYADNIKEFQTIGK